MLSTLAPAAARAAPTPGPTPLAQPLHAPTTATTPSAALSSNAAPVPTPSPLRAPAISASPSPLATTQTQPDQLARSAVATQAAIDQLARSATTAQTAIDPSGRIAAATQTAIDQLARHAAATQTANGALDSNQGATDQASEDGGDTIEAALDWQAFVPTDTADHLATMDRAARDSGCGVPWHLLAAIARVESDFGRNMATSTAGAIGYGQFLPSSWQSFGNDGNVYDYRDALPAIATYLCQSGLERDPRAALFAYNHADWYVDLVLNLAVRYDRMAPGAPTPNVLDTGPASEPSVPMHYAAGRDVRSQTRARTLDNRAVWLGVPWRGRTPGTSISPATLQTTTLAMIRGAFGLTAAPPGPAEAAPDGLAGYADRAWDAGLLAGPIQPPVLLPAPENDRPAQDAQWSIAEIRHTIERGQPLVALVDARLLPGHSREEGDQPIVVVGMTQTGLVYSDPSFSSSLGYGLELGDAEFLSAWQAASTPRQALAFSLRPRPLARDTHLRMADPPPVYARVLPTPAPLAPEVIATPALLVEPVAAEIAPEIPPTTAPAAAVEGPPAEDDPSWIIVLGAGAVLAAAVGIRRLRARRSA